MSKMNTMDVLDGYRDKVIKTVHAGIELELNKAIEDNGIFIKSEIASRFSSERKKTSFNTVCERFFLDGEWLFDSILKIEKSTVSHKIIRRA